MVQRAAETDSLQDVHVIPIHELLSRIRWDTQFATGDFELGYYDRLDDRIVRIGFEEIYFDESLRGVFEVLDAEGVTHNVPLHRVKEVYKDGRLIWQRER